MRLPKFRSRPGLSRASCLDHNSPTHLPHHTNTRSAHQSITTNVLLAIARRHKQTATHAHSPFTTMSYVPTATSPSSIGMRRATSARSLYTTRNQPNTHTHNIHTQ